MVIINFLYETALMTGLLPTSTNGRPGQGKRKTENLVLIDGLLLGLVMSTATSQVQYSTRHWLSF